MSVSRLRTSLIILAASAGLGACAGPFGYGGVSAGYGNYGGYGYPYGGSYYGSRYGYMPSYYGWYNNLYYPGAGYYVYDRYGNPFYWSDAQRRYWERQRDAHRGDRNVNWGEFFRERREAAATTSTIQRSVDGPAVSQQVSTREAVRAERRQQQQVRQEARQEARNSRQEARPQSTSNRPLGRRVTRDDNN